MIYLGKQGKGESADGFVRGIHSWLQPGGSSVASKAGWLLGWDGASCDPDLPGHSHQGQQGEKQHLRKIPEAEEANAMGEKDQKVFVSQGRSTMVFILPPMAPSYCTSLIPTKIPLMEEDEGEEEEGEKGSRWPGSRCPPYQLLFHTCLGAPSPMGQG